MRCCFAERIDHSRPVECPLPRRDGGLRRVHVDAAREIFAMSEQHHRAQRRIVVLVKVSAMRTRVSGSTVLDERAVEPDERDLP
jgi:hypothetical protein